MASFESIKEKALATAGRLAGKSVDIAKTAGEKAKLLGKITKLKTEIAMEKDTIRTNFIEIGKMYYEKHKDNPDPEMAQAVMEAGVSLEAVAIKKVEVELLKKELMADDLDEMAEKELEIELEDVEKEIDEIEELDVEVEVVQEDKE